MCCIATFCMFCIDAVQRIITFCLVFLLLCAVCFGFVVAIVAGVAYGYNYTLAEFKSSNANNATILIRRGQFGDMPDFSGGGRIGLLRSEDETNSENLPLAESLLQNQDARKYSEKLNYYGPSMPEQNSVLDRSKQNSMQFAPQISSIVPIDVRQRDPSEIRWKSFSSDESQEDINSLKPTRTPKSWYITSEMPIKSLGFNVGKRKSTSLEESEPLMELSTNRVRSHTWSRIQNIPEYVTRDFEDVLYTSMV